MQDDAPRPSYNIPLVLADMASLGLLATHVAKRSRLSDMTISRFLSGEVQTAPTAKKIARVLGYRSARRYVIQAASQSAGHTAEGTAR